LYSQMVVESTLTVEELVNDILLGEGVTASNITYNGFPGDSVYVQVGTFNSENSNIPINSGVIMSSGNIQVAVGPNESSGQSNTTGYIAQNGDSDLEQLANVNVNDQAIIEFDFVASADSVKFNYVFASEEYTSFECCTVNDAFGFFLSGPGINGPFENNAINIALIPETDIQVSINTVNSGAADCPDDGDGNCSAIDPNWQENSVYFEYNPFNEDPNACEFDGNTVVLTALSDIDCGSQYHIKLAIADGGDNVYDSAVFLEGGSFAAFGEVFVNVNPVIGGAAVTSPQYEDGLVAGCSEASVQLIRPDGLPVDSIIVDLGGTAIQDEDYYLGDEGDTLFFFPEGVDTLTYSIITKWDGSYGDNEELVITIFWEDGCGNIQSNSATIPFIDPYTLESSTENVEVFCPANFTNVTALGSNGIADYKYNWIDGPDVTGGEGEEVPVSVPVPEDQAYYYVQISDQCPDTVILPIIDSVLVINSIPPPLQTAIAPFVQPECPNQPIDLTALIQDGNPPYNIIWTDDQNNGYVPAETITVADINQSLLGFSPNLEVDLTILDSCGTMVSDSVVINYPLPDSLWVTYPPLTDNCPEDPVSITANTNGGAGEIEYTWSFVQGSENGAEFVPQGANYDQTVAADFAAGMNELQVMVTDKCFRANQDMIGIIFSEDGQTSTYRTGMSLYTDSVPIIKLDPLPNVITPNNDRYNDYFVVAGIETFDNARLEVYDRWGKLVFETDNYEVGSPEMNPLPEDVFDGADLSEGTYFYIVNIDNGECTQSGELQILKSDN